MEKIEPRDRVIVLLTNEELGLLLGCLNESLEAVDDREFQTRLGASKSVVRALGEQLVGMRPGTKLDP